MAGESVPPNSAPKRGGTRGRTSSGAGGAGLFLAQAIKRRDDALSIEGSLCRARPALDPAILTVFGAHSPARN